MSLRSLPAARNNFESLPGHQIVPAVLVHENVDPGISVFGRRRKSDRQANDAEDGCRRQGWIRKTLGIFRREYTNCYGTLNTLTSFLFFVVADER